jgi:hypothetical protein
MKLIELLKMEQKGLLTELNKKLNEKGYYGNVLCTDDYIYAKGDIPVMLVAHLDTVHLVKPKEVFYDKKQDVMWSPQRNWWR